MSSYTLHFFMLRGLRNFTWYSEMFVILLACFGSVAEIAKHAPVRAACMKAKKTKKKKEWQRRLIYVSFRKSEPVAVKQINFRRSETRPKHARAVKEQFDSHLGSLINRRNEKRRIKLWRIKLNGTQPPIIILLELQNWDKKFLTTKKRKMEEHQQMQIK